MKTLVAFPSTGIFGQEVARAFDDVGALEAYFTGFAHKKSGAINRLLSKANHPIALRLLRELERRGISSIAEDKVETRAFLEVLRTAADKGGAGQISVDKIWDFMSKDFTKAAGRRLSRGNIGAIYAYEYTALEAFQAAERCGVAKIIDFPSLNGRQFEELQYEQKAAFPDLRGENDPYFQRLFEVRQGRRDAEMELADVIITNSSVTRNSHIRAGADPEKTFAVSLGAPPTVEEASMPPEGPLKIVWAGTFSIRKAAHIFAAAWREGVNPKHATADIYGAVALPESLRSPQPDGMTFHGSVIRPVLFDALQNADVLMFPTLSDGFGMVVTEAFARGLPVITTDQAGASDLVRHKENGLIIEAGSKQAIIEAVQWCLDNRDALREMRGAALETAKNWQWSHYRAALIEAVSTGLERAGYTPQFASPEPGAENS